MKQKSFNQQNESSWAKKLIRPKPKTKKKVLSLDISLKSISEYILKELGGKVSFSEMARGQLDASHYELKQKALYEGDENLHYDALQLVENWSSSIERLKSHCTSDYTFNVPDIDVVAKEDLVMLQDINIKKENHTLSNLYYMVNEKTGQVDLKFIAEGDYLHRLFVFNMNNDVIELNTFLNLNGKLIFPFLSKFNNSPMESLHDLIEEEKAEAGNPYAYDALYYGDLDNPFFIDYECDRKNLDYLARTLSGILEEPIYRHNAILNRLCVFENDSEKDMEPYHNYNWIPQFEDLASDRKLHIGFESDDVKEEFYFCNYLPFDENKQFLTVLNEGSKKDNDTAINVNRDLNHFIKTDLSLQEDDGEKSLEIESGLDFILYIYVKREEEFIPAGFVHYDLIKSYMFPEDYRESYFQPEYLYMLCNIYAIYLLPEFRNKGGSTAIAEALAEFTAPRFLTSATEFYENEGLKPIEMNVEFSADTVSYGGERTMDKLSEEMEYLKEVNDSCQDRDWNLNSINVGYS